MSYVRNYLETTPLESQTPAAIAYLASLDAVRQSSPTIADAIVNELKNQRENLKLIASENFCSLPVQLSMGNLLTDKYSEGYPGHRFYAGCEQVDAVESEAVELAKKLFGVEHAYVQPHSGSDANLVAFWAILNHKVQQPFLKERTLDSLNSAEFEELRHLLNNQKILGLGLGSGGHLTHGFRQNISAKMFQAIHYEVDPETHLINYDALMAQAMKERPLILIAGYSAYSRLIDFSKMRNIANACGAVLMVDMAHFAGLVAGKVFTGVYNPVPYADILTSTTHKTLRGPRGGIVLCTAEYKEVVDKGCPFVMGGPLPHVMAAKAIAFREALDPSFAAYAAQIVKNAKALATKLTALGAHILTKGTDNHLFVLDTAKTFNLTGRQAETLMRSAHITVNRNSVPKDPHGAWYTSGVRIGTPAMTTLGMKEAEMEQIAEIIFELLRHGKADYDMKKQEPSKAKASLPEEVLLKAKQKVAKLLKDFPLYPELRFR